MDISAIPSALTGLPWKLIAGGVLAASLVGGVLAYGESRADGREAKVDARWVAAANKLQEKSDLSASKSEQGAVKREAVIASALKQEKEKIDDAIEQGRDPFDVQFPSNGLMPDGPPD